MSLRQYTAPVENFGVQICQIGHHEHENRLDDTNVVGESCYKA